MQGAPSRRDVLAGFAGAAVAAIAGCGRTSPEDEAATPEVLPAGAPGRTRPPLPAGEPLLRVRVHSARVPASSVRLGSEGQGITIGRPDEAETVLAGPVRAAVGEGAWSIVDAAGTAAPVDGLDPLELAAVGGAALALGDRTYPGTMRLVARTDEGPLDFDVVSVVPMETYLPGVVFGELYSHWRKETRAAQAIAARSFAESERSHFAARRHYDLTCTPASQVYVGAVTHEPTLEAVRETAGMMLDFDGLLVAGYYCSCCGGTAACATDAIGPNPVNDVIPLLGRDGPDMCTDARVARWTIERTVSQLSDRLRAFGLRRGTDLGTLGTIAALEVVSTNPHGRPRRYAIADASGKSAELSAVALRAAGNFSDAKMPAPKDPLWSSHVSMSIQGKAAVFEGRGFGHGVGLCQYGAETLARRGTGHEEILRWYYPEVEIVRAYESRG